MAFTINQPPGRRFFRASTTGFQTGVVSIGMSASFSGAGLRSKEEMCSSISAFMVGCRWHVDCATTNCSDLRAECQPYLTLRVIRSTLRHAPGDVPIRCRVERPSPCVPTAGLIRLRCSQRQDCRSSVHLSWRSRKRNRPVAGEPRIRWPRVVPARRRPCQCVSHPGCGMHCERMRGYMQQIFLDQGKGESLP